MLPLSPPLCRQQLRMTMPASRLGHCACSSSRLSRHSRPRRRPGLALLDASAAHVHLLWAPAWCRGSRRRSKWACAAQAPDRPSSQVDERRKFLLRYVQDVQPHVMEQFAEHAPSQVVDAMRQTITNMVGTLPPQFFSVTISTVGENLAQLMYSVMMTGYMFRNAQYRCELRSSLALPPGPQAPEGAAAAADSLFSAAGSWGPQPGSAYAAGTQKTRVSGDVLRWNHDTGAEAIPAAQYIDSLESEVALLRQQVAAQQFNKAGHGNELLGYLKGLEPGHLAELTAGAGEDVLEAMNSFIQRLVGTGDEDELRRTTSDCNAVELARLLFWLMVVGYRLRSLEVQYDMEASLDLPLDLAGAPGRLPPGP